MIPIHTDHQYQMIRAEREREYQKAALRRLAREARRREAPSTGAGMLGRLFRLVPRGGRLLRREPVGQRAEARSLDC